MTFQDLEIKLQKCLTVAEFENFLKEDPQAIRNLFYNDHTNEPDNTCFDAEDAARALLDSKFITEAIQGNAMQSPTLVALLIYFISYIERAKLHHLIQRIAQILPDCDLRARTEALFKYKYITNADHDYLNRFTEIIELLDYIYVTGNADIKKHCADIAIEYFTDASTAYQSTDAANYTELKKLFIDQSNISLYQLLSDPGINVIINLPIDCLKKESEEANIRIAKAFYDEAARLLPIPLQTALQSLCKSAGSIHEGRCPPGFHEARERICELYPNAYSQTNTYIKQSLNSSIYTAFDNEVDCIRYLRQYQPLHMPQIEAAVEFTMGEKIHAPENIHILDIGGGAGSLYCVLTSLLHRGFYEHNTFEITIIDPSEIFLKFVDIITERVNHPQLKLRDKLCCRLDQVPQMAQVIDFDWYFIANAITPLIAHSGCVNSAVDTLYDVMMTDDNVKMKKIIIAENTRTSDFDEFCSKLLVKGLHCEILEETNCDGSWLANCQHYVTGQRRLTSPALKYACFKYPKGGTLQ